MSPRPKRAEELSPSMQAVIDRLSEGWELCEGFGGAWVQKYGCNSGGACKTVSKLTVAALWKRKLIQQVSERFAATHRYRLAATAQKGKP